MIIYKTDEIINLEYKGKLKHNKQWVSVDTLIKRLGKLNVSGGLIKVEDMFSILDELKGEKN
jgi:hypothetical protein